MENLREQLHLMRGKMHASHAIGRALWRTIADEVREKSLTSTIGQSFRARTVVFANEPTCGELLAQRAHEHPNRHFLSFEQQRITLGELNQRANAVAAGLSKLGATGGDAVAILSPNCPEFLDTFFATQKLGLGAVPVNTALVEDGLAYVLENSRTRFVIVHRDNLEQVLAVRQRLPSLEKVIVITEGDSEGLAENFETVEQWRDSFENADDPVVRTDLNSVALVLYTSGTTGLPKGVVYRYRNSNIKRMRVLANLLYEPDDVFYSCLPLFHANALLMSAVQALNARAQLALDRRFSASRFWSRLVYYDATTFNALGAMIPILLKQPRSAAQRAHRVRFVASAACPASAWQPFQERFGVRIVEAYAAVDGGGFLTINLGNAPVGSIGKPLGGTRYRLVDPSGNDAAVGTPGELWVWTGKNKRGQVEYYRDENASRVKTRDGWLRTGDLLYRDNRDHLYFAGRNTDSMRRRGENVSAYEVESIIDQHPDVLECAVFGIPSELGEEDIMAVIVPIEGRRLKSSAIRPFLEGKLAHYALPRYVDVVDELPKTGTHRVQKHSLKKRGVSESTWDAENVSTNGGE